MKMKKPLLHILNISLLFLAGVINNIHAEQITLSSEERWSEDGSVFHASNQAIPAHVHEVLVKGIKGQIRIEKLSQVDKSASSSSDTVILVDRTPPIINTQWHHVSAHSNQVTVGPRSELKIKLNDGSFEQIKTEATAVVNADSAVVTGFNVESEAIVIKAVDAFGNVSESNMAFESDFKAPEVKWALLAPAAQNNDTWFASKNAKIHLQVMDESGVAVVRVNTKEITDSSQPISANSGDQLVVVDNLGNQFEQQLNWQEDNHPPYLVINQGDTTSSKGKSFTVRVNQVFELGALDDGVGVASQKYKGKVREWQELPKKFRFINKGNYRIKVKLEDRVGNVFEKSINVKVKR